MGVGGYLILGPFSRDYGSSIIDDNLEHSLASKQLMNLINWLSTVLLALVDRQHYSRKY